jgi:hypothetical protein
VKQREQVAERMLTAWAERTARALAAKAAKRR